MMTDPKKRPPGPPLRYNLPLSLCRFPAVFGLCQSSAARCPAQHRPRRAVQPQTPVRLRPAQPAVRLCMGPAACVCLSGLQPPSGVRTVVLSAAHSGLAAPSAACQRRALCRAEPVAWLHHAGCSEEDSEISGSDNDDATWVSWFCSLKGNEFFCEVDEDFIQDDFNLTGLSGQVRALLLRRSWAPCWIGRSPSTEAHSRILLPLQVPFYEYALDLILDVETPRNVSLSDEQQVRGPRRPTQLAPEGSRAL